MNELEKAILRLVKQMANTNSPELQLALLTVRITQCLDIISDTLKALEERKNG